MRPADMNIRTVRPTRGVSDDYAVVATWSRLAGFQALGHSNTSDESRILL